MTTQQAQWRRDFEKWARGFGWIVDRNADGSYFRLVQDSWEGYLQAAQKYSPTPEERELVEAVLAQDGWDGLDPEMPQPNGWNDPFRRVLRARIALHATRQPPRVDHLAEAKRLLHDYQNGLDESGVGVLLPLVLKHLEALEASK